MSQQYHNLREPLLNCIFCAIEVTRVTRLCRKEGVCRRAFRRQDAIMAIMVQDFKIHPKMPFQFLSDPAETYAVSPDVITFHFNYMWHYFHSISILILGTLIQVVLLTQVLNDRYLGTLIRVGLLLTFGRSVSWYSYSGGTLIRDQSRKCLAHWYF